MKSRTSLLVWIAFVLVTLIGLWWFYQRETQPPAQMFPAIVNRDCAPWDGSAFKVSVPWHDGSTVAISIYRSPDINSPTSFSFPEASSEGQASLLFAAGSPEPLTGEVRFSGVEQGRPVEGSFQFRSEKGVQFEGKFVAEWGEEVIYCG